MDSCSFLLLFATKQTTSENNELTEHLFCLIRIGFLLLGVLLLDRLAQFRLRLFLLFGFLLRRIFRLEAFSLSSTEPRRELSLLVLQRFQVEFRRFTRSPHLHVFRFFVVQFRLLRGSGEHRIRFQRGQSLRLVLLRQLVSKDLAHGTFVFASFAFSHWNWEIESNQRIEDEMKEKWLK